MVVLLENIKKCIVCFRFKSFCLLLLLLCVQLLRRRQVALRFVTLHQTPQAWGPPWDQPFVTEKETKFQCTLQEGKDRKRKEEMAG